MKIQVEAKHIDASRSYRGGAHASQSCPIALAIKEQIKATLFVSVGATGCYIRLFGQQAGKSKQFNNEVCQFINDFDNHRPVKPFSFEIVLE